MNKITFIKGISILFFFTTFFSCGGNKTAFNNENDKEWDIKAIKFMGTITTQPYSLMEKSFWVFYDEHVVLKIRNNDFIENVKKLPTNDGSNFYFLTYAFLVRNNNTIDTIYADHSLKTWKVIKQGKRTYYYDSEGIIAEDLRDIYSFFSDCW